MLYVFAFSYCSWGSQSKNTEVVCPSLFQGFWCFWTVVLEKTLESPLDCKEIKPVNLKGSQPWIVIGRTDAETPILWPPSGKSQPTGKDPDARKDWGQEQKAVTEDEMARWCHWLNGHECEQAPGDGEGQGSLACCSPWACKETDTTQWLNNKGIRRGLSKWHSGKVSACQHRRCRFDPWVRKVAWRRKTATHSSILARRIPRT